MRRWTQTFREAASPTRVDCGTTDGATIAQVWPCWVQVTIVRSSPRATL